MAGNSLIDACFSSIKKNNFVDIQPNIKIKTQKLKKS